LPALDQRLHEISSPRKSGKNYPRLVMAKLAEKPGFRIAACGIDFTGLAP
jgi:hypothetical protein